MSLKTYIAALPKVELHVHLEGAIRPETLLKLAKRHGVPLPARTVKGLQQWYRFKDFPHFVEIYITISNCLRTPDDIELITREFLAGQAAQNIRYTEVTYTAFTHYSARNLSFADQLAAINRARTWARRTHNVDMGVIVDIARETSAHEGVQVADWAISAHGDGVVALGLGGYEVGNPPEKFGAAFARARAAGLPLVLHAGETAGPESIWGALKQGAVRLGHGVRCLEDPALVAELRERQVPLEVCPTSNVCLGIAPDFNHHPLPTLIDLGLYVTVNSDDPPMFDITLTGELERCVEHFGMGADDLERLQLAAIRASLLPPERRAALEAELIAGFAAARSL